MTLLNLWIYRLPQQRSSELQDVKSGLDVVSVFWTEGGSQVPGFISQLEASSS